MPLLKHPLTPFVDNLRVPPRLVFDEPGRVVVPLETAEHRFHRDLPSSQVWTYRGFLPGPTIEVDRGVELEVRWENTSPDRCRSLSPSRPSSPSTGYRRSARLDEAEGNPIQLRRRCRVSRSSTSTAA